MDITIYKFYIQIFIKYIIFYFKFILILYVSIFTNIYNSVIGTSKKEGFFVYFTIMCIKSPDPNGARKNYYGDDNSYSCDNYDGYQRWWVLQIKRTGGEVIPKNNIQSEQIKRRVIQKIQNAFPDSNITKGYENCCDTYNITW